jgi:hypothetical protein
MMVAATGAWAQDQPSHEQLAHAVDICEKEFMVACTPGGDPRKERCFTVPACYQVVHQFYGELLEKLNHAQDLDRKFIEDTAKGLSV